MLWMRDPAYFTRIYPFILRNTAGIGCQVRPEVPRDLLREQARLRSLVVKKARCLKTLPATVGGIPNKESHIYGAIIGPSLTASHLSRGLCHVMNIF